MSLFVSKEIKGRVNLDKTDLHNNCDSKVDVAIGIIINEENAILQLLSKNKLKKEYIIDRFLFDKKEYKFTRKIKFNLRSLKKVNTNLVAEIIICKDEFWRYLDNEEQY